MVKEVADVSKEKGAVIVEGNEKENQIFSEKVANHKEKNVLIDSVTEDKRNQAVVAARKKAQQEALERSIAQEKAKNEALQKEMAQKEADRLRAAPGETRC